MGAPKGSGLPELGGLGLAVLLCWASPALTPQGHCGLLLVVCYSAQGGGWGHEPGNLWPPFALSPPWHRVLTALAHQRPPQLLLEWTQASSIHMAWESAGMLTHKSGQTLKSEILGWGPCSLHFIQHSWGLHNS